MIMLLLLKMHVLLIHALGGPKMDHLFHSVMVSHPSKNMFMTYPLLYNICFIIFIYPTNMYILPHDLLLLYGYFYALNLDPVINLMIFNLVITFLHS